jgi:hypothetical protein
MKYLLLLVTISFLSCEGGVKPQNDCLELDIIDSLTEKTARLCRTYQDKAEVFMSQGNRDSALKYLDMAKGIVNLGYDMYSYYSLLSK